MIYNIWALVGHPSHADKWWNSLNWTFVFISNFKWGIKPDYYSEPYRITLAFEVTRYPDSLFLLNITANTLYIHLKYTWLMYQQNMSANWFGINSCVLYNPFSTSRMANCFWAQNAGYWWEYHLAIPGILITVLFWRWVLNCFVAIWREIFFFVEMYSCMIDIMMLYPLLYVGRNLCMIYHGGPLHVRKLLWNTTTDWMRCGLFKTFCVH